MGRKSNYNESYHRAPAPEGPRPEVKLVRKENGIRVLTVESIAEMRVRMDGLRKMGDTRSAWRILDALESYHPRRTYSRRDTD